VLAGAVIRPSGSIEHDAVRSHRLVDDPDLTVVGCQFSRLDRAADREVSLLERRMRCRPCGENGEAIRDELARRDARRVGVGSGLP
jgi:hypothetical protein